MKVWSLWQKKKTKLVKCIETLIIETADYNEAKLLHDRFKKQGVDVRLAGPHDPTGTDSDIFPLEY